jgi:hypothetical protein
MGSGTSGGTITATIGRELVTPAQADYIDFVYKKPLFDN